MLFSTKGHRIRRVTFFFIESSLIFLCVLIAVAVRFSFDPNEVFAYSLMYYKAFLIAVVFQLCFYYNDLYLISLRSRYQEWLIKILQAMATAAILIAVIYYIFPDLIIGRGIFLITLIMIPIVVVGWRYLYYRISRMGHLRDRLLIIGTGSMARQIGEEILEHYREQYEIVGFIDEDRGRVGESIVNPRVIGDYRALSDIVSGQSIDRVIVALPDRRGKLPVNSLLDCRFRGTPIDDGVTFYERLVGKIAVSGLKPSWFIFSEGFNRVRLTLMAKRILDVLSASVAVTISLPLFAVCSILIKLDSKGPVFFRQDRIGEGERPFTLLKFRSMRTDAESETGPVWAQANDSRTTRMGRFLRKTRIDELPQLINVLKGDMSFVGPRPERPFFIAQLEKDIPYYSARHTVKPGITGWAQIKYAYGASKDDALEKLQYDLFYIKHLSFLLDLTILFETVKVVLLTRGSR